MHLKLIGNVEGTPKELFVYKIKFLTAEQELKQYFFAKVERDLPNFRYLLSVPHTDPEGLNTQELLDSVRKTKEDYLTKYYILTDGTIKEIQLKARNCINGMYSGNNIFCWA